MGRRHHSLLVGDRLRAGAARPTSPGDGALAWIDVIERLAGLDDEYRAIEARLADPDVIADLRQLRDLNRRYKELGAVVDAYRRYRQRRGRPGRRPGAAGRGQR